LVFLKTLCWNFNRIHIVMATGPDPGCSSTTPQSTNVDELDHQLPPSLEVLRLRLLRAAGGAAAATGSLQRAPEVLRLPTPPKHGKNTLCPKAHEKDAAEARQKHSAPRSAHKKAHSGRQRTAKSTLSPSAHLKKTLCRQSTAKTRATAPKFSLRLLRVFTRSCCQYDT
jgi:hypothetical protein